MPGQSPSEAGSGSPEKEVRTISQYSTLSPRITGTISNRSGDRSSLHSKSVTRDKQLRVEQGLKHLSEKFADLALVRRSKTLVDAFDLTRLRAELVSTMEDRADALRAKQLRQQTVRLLRQFVAR